MVVRSLGLCVIGKFAPFLIKLLTSSSSAPPSSTTLLNSTSTLPLLNGHVSPFESSTLTNDDAPYDSESDLSEVANPIVDEPSPAPSRNHQPEFGAQDTDASESSAAEVQDESEDADFDMEDSPAPTAPDRGRQDRSTSTESRPAKRKLDLEDEHIQANPELYGLRRSVCYFSMGGMLDYIADSSSQARPVQHRTIVVTPIYIT
jgi:chromodomain-helicase-DNA-binding protein 1